MSVLFGAFIMESTCSVSAYLFIISKSTSLGIKYCTDN